MIQKFLFEESQLPVLLIGSGVKYPQGSFTKKEIFVQDSAFQI